MSYDYRHQILPLMTCFLPSIAKEFTTQRQCVYQGQVLRMIKPVNAGKRATVIKHKII